MSRPVLISGTEFVAPELPEGAYVVSPPAPASGLRSVRAAVKRALEAPLDGEPLAERLHERDRVLVVFDSPAFPVPAMRADPRRPAIDALLELFAAKGLVREQVRLLCASGVERIYAPAELASLVGDAPAAGAVECHDAEALDRFTLFATTPQGEPLELDSALSEADLVVTVSLVQTPLDGGWSTLVSGLASARTARAFLNAENLSQGASPFDPRTSKLHRALRRAGKLLEKKLEVFALELVIDTRMWPVQLSIGAKADGTLSRPLLAWNAIPEPIRARASRLFRADFQTVAVLAGSTDKVHARALEVLDEHAYSKVEQRADVALLGVAAMTPHAANSLGNPVLSAASAFGYQLGWHRGGPLFKKGGVVILLSPLAERFDKPRHLPYADFYDQVLAAERDPLVIAGRFEGLFSGRPQYVSAYRRRNAYHGLHPFISWYLACNTMSRCSKIIAVGAARRPAERLGYTPVATLEQALAAAREALGKEQPTIAVPAGPPAFGLDLR